MRVSGSRVADLHKMKMLLAALLLAVVYMELAQSLTCYTCHEPVTTSACTMIRNCSNNETMCKTTLYSREDVYPYLGDSTVTKMCAPRCVPSDVDGIGITRPVTCCNTDLCNSDGAASLQASPVVVGLTTTALCMLLRTGLSWSLVGEGLWP
ncbi:PREDICTED: ly6/PLAUR domain-containing protein 2-like [Gavialis gangeticus]|uniref:ly6/PLAUR domain-containing protein 2-like n=1 Tax=Gavialis gangeticus TaxID=94835 RepID=UPI00092FA953|nr:PREDICTED: ly6/PLAUR domain-containing protein 2-like [Gavialis gangeticus]